LKREHSHARREPLLKKEREREREDREKTNTFLCGE